VRIISLPAAAAVQMPCVAATQKYVAAAQKSSNWSGMTSALCLHGIAATKMPYFSGLNLSRTCRNDAD